MSDVAFPHDEYKAALRTERIFREEVFLELPDLICGVEVNQITPFLLARLRLMDTPFLTGKPAIETEVIRFLWALSPEFAVNQDKMDKFIEFSLVSINDRWEDAEIQIDNFITKTFLDVPRGGGGDCVPYVTGVAWLIYKMGCKPFRWKEKRTLHTPLRKIYQYLRCYRIETGGILFNEISDKIKATWLDEVNQASGGKN